MSWSPNGRTPWSSKHLLHNMEELLVATSKGVCSIIRQRMCHMSTEQDIDKTPEATFIPNHSGNQPWTLHDDQYWLDYQITDLWGMGLHSYYYRGKIMGRVRERGKTWLHSKAHFLSLLPTGTSTLPDSEIRQRYKLHYKNGTKRDWVMILISIT